MSMIPDPVLDVIGLEKAYGGLRPLRMQALRLEAGALVAVMGLDAPAAEMFTNLATGAILPDRGEVRLFGRTTAAVTDSEAWLKLLDQVGILTDRAVLLDALTVAQNLAMPLTLDVDPLPSGLVDTVAGLAREVRLDASVLDRPAGSLDSAGRLRVRFGRALALSPRLLLMEHPTATLERADVPAFAATVRDVVSARRLAAMAATADREFATALTSDVRELRPADGALVSRASAWGRVLRLLDRRD